MMSTTPDNGTNILDGRNERRGFAYGGRLAHTTTHRCVANKTGGRDIAYRRTVLRRPSGRRPYPIGSSSAVVVVVGSVYRKLASPFLSTALSIYYRKTELPRTIVEGDDDDDVDAQMRTGLSDALNFMPPPFPL